MGTFAYTVTYPAAGSAQIKLEPWPLGGEVLIDNVSVDSGVLGSKDVPGGMYFLTVKATVDDITIPRSEIVHIYPALTSNANYVFTKLDFGDDSLQIGGTIKVLIDGQPLESGSASISVGAGSNYLQTSVNFIGNDGNGEWSFNLDNLQGADTLYFRVTVADLFIKELAPVPVPVDDKPDIDLGTVNFETVLLNHGDWVEGSFPASVGSTEDRYRINVSAGETYYFWMNNGYEGNGTKTASANMTARYSNGYFLFGVSNAWYFPRSFTATTNGTVYLSVYTYGNWDTTTYAIMYSTNASNVLDEIAIPLVAETWKDGYVPADESQSIDWYSLEVTENTTYYFWMNNREEGDGSKTAYAHMQARYSDGSYIFSTNNAWYLPRAFTAETSGTVYVRVEANRYDWNSTATYAIVYSDKSDWLKVAERPTITTQPVSAMYIPGETAQALTVVASVSSGALSYQWYKAGTNTAIGAAIAEATSASYTPDTSAVGTAYYYVVVTNTDTTANAGAQTAITTSNRAAVRVAYPEEGLVEEVSLTNGFYVVYRFDLPSGRHWEDYAALTVDYRIDDENLLYREGSSRAMRLMGPYVMPNGGDFDFITTDEGKNMAIASYGNGKNAEYIIDQISTNQQAPIATVAANEGVDATAGQWFTLPYKIDGSRANGSFDFANMPSDDATGPFYFGVGWTGRMSGDDTVITVQLIKNVTLVGYNSAHNVTAIPAIFEDDITGELYPAFTGYPTASGNGVEEANRYSIGTVQAAPIPVTR
jgi:hypothetical protein